MVKMRGYAIKSDYVIEDDLEHVLALLTPPNQLVCRVMLHTGLRVGDVLALRTADIKPQMTITEAKTGKSKRIGLPADLRSALLAQAGEVYVFEGRSGPERHRTRQAVWADLRRAAKALRMDMLVVSPHSMRKVYAVELMERYGDIERVRRSLNHDRVETTLLYAMADRLTRQRALTGQTKKGRKGKTQMK